MTRRRTTTRAQQNTSKNKKNKKGDDYDDKVPDLKVDGGTLLCNPPARSTTAGRIHRYQRWRRRFARDDGPGGDHGCRPVSDWSPCLR